MSTKDNQHIDPTLDLYSGALFTAIGLGAMIIARSYPMGSIDRMGPGFFPMVLGAIMAVLGIVLVLKNLEGFRQSYRPNTPLPHLPGTIIDGVGDLHLAIV